MILSWPISESVAVACRSMCGGHRVGETERAIPVRPLNRLAQGQEPDSPAMIRARDAKW
jgi:hypothetical protein